MSVLGVKREGEDDGLMPVSKRQQKVLAERSSEALDVLSSVEEPLSQDDVVYYQKEAIYRLWHIQFKENKRLQARFQKTKVKYKTMSTYCEILNQWWRQLVENLKSVGNLTLPEGVNQDVLLSIGDSFKHIDAKGDTEIETRLNHSRDELIKLIQPILSSLSSNSSQLNEKDKKIMSLENNVTGFNVLKNSLIKENNELKQTLEELNDQIDILIKQSDRSQSKSINRMKEAAKNAKANDQNDDNKSKNDNEANDDKPNNDSNPNRDVNSNETGNSNISVHELEDLRIKLAELEGKNSALNEQLEEKLAKLNELELKIIDLNNNIKNDSISSKEPKRADDQDNLKVKVLESQIDKLEQSKKKIESQMFELESNFTLNKTRLEEITKNELEQSNSLIAKLEQDVNRLRAERDSANTKLSVLKTEKSSNDLLNNYEVLVKTLEDRLNELDKRNDVSTTSNDEFNKILTNELKQMEEAFKKTREVAAAKLLDSKESQILINKLQIEKSKADEKYFQAMRTKDSLSAQNKVLQSNLSKQKELIDALKDEEQGLKKKLEIETKLYEKISLIEQNYNNKVIELRSKIEHAENQARIELERSKTIQNEIAKKQIEISQLQKRITNSEEEISGLKSKSSKLENLVKKYRTDSRTEEDEEINQALLSMTKCQLCAKNFKDVTLKTCGHCFCKSCVDDRLNARMRKCPNCNSQFSRYDLLTIHL